ncbi:MAG: YgeY family selenium metabolism-linked hydrolase [Chloroflexota bacterium]
MSIIEQIQSKITDHREDMLTFFREIVAIPSTDSDIGAVGKRVEAELHKLNYDAVWWDKMGCIVGRIGDEDADYHLLYDSHLDTVGIGDPDEWDWHPFEGKTEDGTLFARGACDEKASTPGMLYGLAFARDLGLIPDNMAVYYFGNIEEVNEGASANAFVMTEGIRPDFVVVGEPTNLNIARGQKGRVEYQIVAKGKSAHAASNHLGDNALYKLLPIVDKIRQSQDSLPSDDFLGDAKITVTSVEVNAGSRNVVPSLATAYVDRRLTLGEDAYEELDRLRNLVGDRDDITITIPEFDEPSYTGFIFPLEMVYPTWLLEEDHPFVQASLSTAHDLGMTPDITKWDFSTNGIYWAGKANIPTVGFGPGEEQYAHTVLDQVRLEDVVNATAWYALLPTKLKGLLL